MGIITYFIERGLVMNNFPIISHVDILFSIFKNRELMSRFSVSQLEELKSYIDLALDDKSFTTSDFELLD